MTFEENFPSLNKKMKSYCSEDLEYLDETISWLYDDLKECCLDKQKVREAIEDLVMPNGFLSAFNLKKRLGLDKEVK